MRFKNYILAPENVNEASYQGNIGFEELAKFYQVANDEEIEQMENILKNEDWASFKQLIYKVLRTRLK